MNNSERTENMLSNTFRKASLRRHLFDSKISLRRYNVKSILHMSTQSLNSSSVSNNPKLRGKATVAGTQAFVEAFKLPLYHCFSFSGLRVNPIVHGPPLYLHDPEIGPLLASEKADEYMERALLRNGSNCVYVYNHYMHRGESLVWSSNKLKQLLIAKNDTPSTHSDDMNNNDSLTRSSMVGRRNRLRTRPGVPATPAEKEKMKMGGETYQNVLKREGIVAIAGLGVVTEEKEMMRRLQEAYEKSELEYIDMVIVGKSIIMIIMMMLMNNK